MSRLLLVSATTEKVSEQVALHVSFFPVVWRLGVTFSAVPKEHVFFPPKSGSLMRNKESRRRK